MIFIFPKHKVYTTGSFPFLNTLFVVFIFFLKLILYILRIDEKLSNII